MNYNLSPWSIDEVVYNWIINNIPAKSIILELGSGEATGLLSETYTMYSVEDKEIWVGKYNSNYIYAPLVNGWYDVEILKKSIPKNYDLFFIDGPEWERRGVLKHLDLFDLSKTILLDNLDRVNDMFIATELSKITNRKLIVTDLKGGNKFGVILAGNSN